MEKPDSPVIDDCNRRRQKQNRHESSDSSISSEECSKRRKKARKERSRSREGKKRKKDRKKSKKKDRSRSSSSGSDTWVEKQETAQPKPSDSYDWTHVESLIPTYSSNKEVKVRKDVNKCITEAPGQTSKELNPYWKNGGTGLPSEEKDLKLTSSMVGDRGLEWYERALKRAEETAKKEGRPLSDVVSERWGSLEKLTELISQAKSENDRRRDRGRGKPRGFRKPGEEFGREYVDRRESYKREWKKPSYKDDYVSHERMKEPRRTETTSSDNDRGVPSSSQQTQGKQLEVPLKNDGKVLTDEELNALAAKMVKAEILGKSEVVEKLKKQLCEARTARENASNTVILMQTNKQGVTIPVKPPTLREPLRGRRKDSKMETHSDGQRTRYFADDDSRDLRQMFVQEKLSTADDDKDLFIKMAARRSGRGSDEEDAAFADAARISEATGKIQQREHDRAVHDAQRRKKTLDGCQWCLDNSQRSKHLVVSIGETCYLCLPAEESLTPHHCLLVPIEHSPCGTQLDENVWEEMHRFRRAIVSMANELDQDVFFFEQARGLKNFPHMVLHCVVLDREIGSMAPIYFKKALLESESEWSDNKKVVDIKGPDVRRSVPKGLPYFAVEFPPQGGFAHVIEDENLFPANFAHSIVGGMLDLDHRTWRKAHKITHAAQREKALAFSKTFSNHDFNRKDQNKTKSSSSSSD